MSLSDGHVPFPVPCITPLPPWFAPAIACKNSWVKPFHRPSGSSGVRKVFRTILMRVVPEGPGGPPVQPTAPLTGPHCNGP
jgi:hypothetical protein